MLAKRISAAGKKLVRGLGHHTLQLHKDIVERSMRRHKTGANKFEQIHHGDGMNKEQVLRRYAPEQESGADRLQAGLVQ